MTTRKCPQCEQPLPADAPSGVCPKCVMGLAANSAGLDSTYARPGVFQSPSPSALAPHFPQLEILEWIGQGGMGAVYLAKQRGLDRPVALKILPPEISSDPSFSERFSREARALARLSHPNIVGVHDCGEAGGYYFMLMEYVEGINLREAIETKSLTAQEALAIVPQICDALQYAHDENIVHRDIKPENVLLDKNGQIKVADFGLAKLVEPTPDQFTLTGTYQVMGTPRYMAPEQIERTRDVDHRADIYSLGVVFYELLTGELPLGRFAAPSQKAPIDARLDEVVFRTLEKEPQRRYQQISEVKSEVQLIGAAKKEVPQKPNVVSASSSDHRMHDARADNRYEYRSAASLFGMPLVHVKTGTDPETKQPSLAKGVIAVGDRAIGVLAIGGGAMGFIAIGGCAVGVFTLGGLGLGMVFALAGMAISFGVAIGGCAIGLLAAGGFAMGYVSWGGIACGHYACGGEAWGNIVWAPFDESPGAREVFELMRFKAPKWLALISVGATGLFLVYLIQVWTSIIRQDRFDSDTTNQTFDSDRVFTPKLERGGLVIVIAICVTMAFSILAAIIVIRAQFIENADLHPAIAHDHESDGHGVAQMDRLPPQPHWKWTPKGPRATERFRIESELTPIGLQQTNDAIDEIFQEYLALEQKNMTRELNEDGHQVVKVTPFTKDAQQLEHRLLSKLDEWMTVEQEKVARTYLNFYTIKIGEGQTYTTREVVEPGILGWGPSEPNIEMWQVGKWYHWQVTIKGRGHRIEGSGPELPVVFARFWSDEKLEPETKE